MFLNQGPGGNGGVLYGLVVFVLVLETVVRQVNHQIGLILNVLLSIILNAQPQIPRVVKHDRWIAVHEHVTSDVKLLIVQQQRPHVMLNQPVVLQLRVLPFLLLFS